jgi:hypothetical protein
MGSTTKARGFAQTPQKMARRTKSEPIEFDDRWVANLIREAKAEEAAHPMSTEELLAEEERLVRARAKRAKELGIKTDIRSAVRIIHEYRRARRSS